MIPPVALAGEGRSTFAPTDMLNPGPLAHPILVADIDVSAEYQ